VRVTAPRGGVMTNIGKVHTTGLLILALAAMTLAGCGNNAAPGGAAGSSGAPATSARPSAPAMSSPAQAEPAPSVSAVVPGGTVVSYRVTYPWHWPNDVTNPAKVRHATPVPPVPQLVAIRVGDHPGGSGERPYNRMSFTFTTGFPSYEVGFVGALTNDASGQPVPLAGDGVLRVIFRQAQGHTAAGGSSVTSQPPARLGLSRMVGWAPAGDFEGVLTYGIGIRQPVPNSNPQFPVRTTEVEKITAQGQHLYVVAIDIDATPLGG
jgi:hypothetical protein